MFKKLTGTILGLSIAFTSLSAAPARAGDKELAAFLFGIGAIAIIANQANKKNETRKIIPKPVPPKHVHKHKGNKCMLKRWTHNGWVSYRDPKCGYVHKPKPVAKPKVCLRKKWAPSGWKNYYSAQCLRQHGFKV
ncbi:MAG: hypothetical protein P8Q99_12185 [Paracoccaceae bacterium]|jgi:hypothetical protein|nr:hypothetical protein RB2150_13021 [Rhodobacteraceae bacterium HTCC2150]MDG1532095.1 hypothetical protein [Paracoccaceae bacterium]